mmetsp:Transcript_6173/g.17836  ORF Transcript_6173/g.17836 Transcript_6173/m.17836 type:complete len:136 (-) Transcript_6173:111-518(-)
MVERCAPAPGIDLPKHEVPYRPQFVSSARFSTASAEAVDKLACVNEELTGIEQRVRQILAELPTSQSPADLKTELAQLESKAKQLETTGIDDVYTGELNSGKQVAKQSKKDMLARLEVLFATVDETFKKMRAKGT